MITKCIKCKKTLDTEFDDCSCMVKGFTIFGMDFTYKRFNYKHLGDCLKKEKKK